MHEIGKRYYEKNKEKLKEYRKKNKDKIKEINRKYREKNKDQIKEIGKIYYKKNKDKIMGYQKKNKDKIREYREKNAEREKEKSRKYREKNKYKTKERNKNHIIQDPMIHNVNPEPENIRSIHEANFQEEGMWLSASFEQCDDYTKALQKYAYSCNTLINEEKAQQKNIIIDTKKNDIATQIVVGDTVDPEDTVDPNQDLFMFTTRTKHKNEIDDLFNDGNILFLENE